jgi:phosphoglycerol transferase MdoB-like AlkP superfamily enzyme
MADLNYWVLIVFAPLLILTGIAGFIIPADKSLTSGAPAYNIFHILFGTAGILVATHHHDAIRYFNIGFGLIDLYQAAASYFHWFPEKQFRWKSSDDILHVVIGAGLVLVGIFGS